MHHALLVCTGPTVSTADMDLPQFAPETAEVEGGAERLAAAMRSMLQNPSSNLYQLIIDTLVRAAYLHCSCNQVQTAQLLGISRNVLRAHLIRLQLIKGR